MPQGKRQERRGSGAARRRGKRSPRRAGSRSATPALFTITEEEEGQRRRGAGRSKKKGMTAKIKREPSGEPAPRRYHGDNQPARSEESPLSLETGVDVCVRVCECEKRLTTHGGVSTRASDESERAVRVVVAQDRVLGFLRCDRFRLCSTWIRTRQDPHSSASVTLSPFVFACIRWWLPCVMCRLSVAWSLALSLARAGANPLGAPGMLPACSPSSGSQSSVLIVHSHHLIYQ